MANYWALVSNEGRGRPTVDFGVYLEFHLRVAKALLERAEDFDEEEERVATQADWAEDCGRCGLRVASELTPWLC